MLLPCPILVSLLAVQCGAIRRILKELVGLSVHVYVLSFVVDLLNKPLKVVLYLEEALLVMQYLVLRLSSQVSYVDFSSCGWLSSALSTPSQILEDFVWRQVAFTFDILCCNRLSAFLHRCSASFELPPLFLESEATHFLLRFLSKEKQQIVIRLVLKFTYPLHLLVIQGDRRCDLDSSRLPHLDCR